MLKPIVLIIMLSTVLGLAGCKYDEGPWISLRSELNRINGAKNLTEYRVDGQDSLSILLQGLATACSEYNGGTIVFSYDADRDEGYMRHFLDTGLDCEGYWYLPDSENRIFLNMPGLSVNAVEWNVIRLTKKDLWLEFQNDDHFWELRFKEQQ